MGAVGVVGGGGGAGGLVLKRILLFSFDQVEQYHNIADKINILQFLSYPNSGQILKIEGISFSLCSFWHYKLFERFEHKFYKESQKHELMSIWKLGNYKLRKCRIAPPHIFEKISLTVILILF